MNSRNNDTPPRNIRSGMHSRAHSKAGTEVGWLRRKWRQVREQRGGKILRVSAGSVVIVVGCTLGWTLWQWTRNYVHTSPVFNVKTIDLQGNQRLSREEILNSVGLGIGKNIFQVSAAEVEASLKKQGWIAEAEVQRRLPSTYRIRVREYEPLALILLDKLYLLSSEGIAFKEWSLTDPADLPVVTGAKSELFHAHAAYRQRVVQNLLAFFGSFDRSALQRQEKVSQVHLEFDLGLTVYLAAGTIVRVGGPPYETKIARWTRVNQRLLRDRRAARRLDLSNQKNPHRVVAGLQ